MSLIAEREWQLEKAEHLARESVALHRETGHLHMIVTNLTDLGWILGNRGKFGEQLEVLEETLGMCYGLGVRRHTAEVHYWLGAAELNMGRYDRARAQAEVGLAIAREYDSPRDICHALFALGMVALVEGGYAEAHRALLEAQSHWPENPYAPSLLGIASLRRGEMHQAREHIGAALRVAADTRYHLLLTIALPACALLLADRGDADAVRAVELYALASRYPHVANSCWFAEVAGMHVSAAAADLPSEAFLAAQERGRTRDLWETVEELLDELRG